MPWMTFLISAVVIVFAGIQLTKCADILSDRFHWGKTWIGIVLLGFVTSLPEAITSLASVISINADDLAVGNILGSNNFNPLLIVLMDFAYRKGAVTNDISYKKVHVFSAVFAVVLTGIVIAEIGLGGLGISLTRIGPFSLGTFSVGILYFVFIYKLSRVSDEDNEDLLEVGAESQEPTYLIFVKLFFSIAFVVGGAIFLANSADMLAETTGLGRTFVGSIFLAIATSLPEVVVTLAALKLGQLDLAIGNIFGSNMTNVFILSLCELFHKGAPILSRVSCTHIFTGAMSIVLVTIAMAGIRFKGKKKILFAGIDSWIMLILFILGTGLLYQFR